MRLVHFKRRELDVWVNADRVWTVEHANQPTKGVYETAIRMGSGDDACIIVDGRCDVIAACLMDGQGPNGAHAHGASK